MLTMIDMVYRDARTKTVTSHEHYNHSIQRGTKWCHDTPISLLSITPTQHPQPASINSTPYQRAIKMINDVTPQRPWCTAPWGLVE